MKLQKPKRTIFEAARLNDFHEVSSLLREGNDVNERDDWGATCLHLCATFGSLECTKVLIGFGADLEVKDRESGWTPLHRAFYFKQTSVAIFLIACGAILDSVDAVDYEGLTPLSLLSLQLKSDILKARENIEAGTVMVFGKADYALGIPLPKASEVLKPKIVESLLLESITDIQATKYHSFALASSGQLYSWGHGKGGRLGHGDDKSKFEPTLIASFLSLPIEKVSASDSHVLAVTTSGVIFSWGSNTFGQLGHGSGEALRSISSPKRIETLKNITVIGISAGEQHSLCYTDNNEVYAWGNNDKGQVGVPTTFQTIVTPKRIMQASFNARKQGGTCITQIVTSVSCSLLLAHTRGSGSEVYTWGNGDHHFRKVHFNRNLHPFDCFVTQLAANRDMGFAVAKSGLVYSWNLQLSANSIERGRQYFDWQLTPRIFEAIHPKNGGEKIAFISASSNKVYMTTEVGEMYCWTLEYDKNEVLEPLLRKIVGVKRAIKVAAGSDHTLMLISPTKPTVNSHPFVSELAIPSLLTFTEMSLMGRINLKNIVDALLFSEKYRALKLKRYCLQYMTMNFDIALVLNSPAKFKRYIDECLWPESIEGIGSNVQKSIESKDTKLDLGRPLMDQVDVTTISSIEQLAKMMRSTTKKLQDIAILQEKINNDKGFQPSNEQLAKVEKKNILQIYFSRMEQQMVRLRHRVSIEEKHEISPIPALLSTRCESTVTSQDPMIPAANVSVSPVNATEPALFEMTNNNPWKKFPTQSLTDQDPVPKDSSPIVTFNKSIDSRKMEKKTEGSKMHINLMDYIVSPIKTNNLHKKTGHPQQQVSTQIATLMGDRPKPKQQFTPWSLRTDSKTTKQSLATIQEQEEVQKRNSNTPRLKGNEIHWYVERKPRAQSLESLMVEQELERQEKLELELALKQIAEMEEREAQKSKCVGGRKHTKYTKKLGTIAKGNG